MAQTSPCFTQARRFGSSQCLPGHRSLHERRRRLEDCRDGWWEAGKPSVIAASGRRPETHYNDQFVEDVKRTMQATGMFFFFPVQFWNDNGYVPHCCRSTSLVLIGGSIGSSANFLSTMLIGNGVPNDVIGNFNSLSIIVLGPVLNVSASLLSALVSMDICRVAQNHPRRHNISSQALVCHEKLG